MESEDGYVDNDMTKDLFGFSTKNQFEVPRPDRVSLLSVAIGFVVFANLTVSNPVMSISTPS